MGASEITAIIGLLSLISGGVLAFARESIKNAREESTWWREKGAAILESQQQTLEAEVRKDEERDAKICEALHLLRTLREPAKRKEDEHGDK